LQMHNYGHDLPAHAEALRLKFTRVREARTR
jgi:hypothetical protein